MMESGFRGVANRSEQRCPEGQSRRDLHPQQQVPLPMGPFGQIHERTQKTRPPHPQKDLLVRCGI